MKNRSWAWAILAGMPIFVAGCSGNINTPILPAVNGLNGALAARGVAGSVIAIDGSAFGTPASSAAGYSVAFEDAMTADLVAEAAVDLSTPGNWTDDFIKATVPSQLAVGKTYMVVVKTPSGTSNAASFIVVPPESFSPQTMVWSETSPLPAARQGFSTVAGTMGTGADVFIYAIGGNTATSGTAGGDAANEGTVFMNRVNSGDGTLVDPSWTSLTGLPGKRGFAAAVLANSYSSTISGTAIYVLGGLDGTGTATDTVYYALPTSYGTIPAPGSGGSWTTTTPLPQPLSAAAVAIFHGWIYVAGGDGRNGAPVAAAYCAKINPGGTLGSWTTLTSLPVPLAFHRLVVLNGTLCVLGGDNASADPISGFSSAAAQDSVYFDPIDQRTGALGAAWTVGGNGLSGAREKFTAAAAGSEILVSGGLYAGHPGSSEESYASVNADGSLTSFTAVTGLQTISGSGGYAFYNHSSCLFVDASGNAHVLILGGADVATGALHADVWCQH